MANIVENASVIEKPRVTSVLFVCDKSTSGHIVMKEEVKGKYINSVVGSTNGMLVFCTDGVYSANNGSKVCTNEFVLGVYGLSFNVAITRAGEIYSWGVVGNGELGHGISRQEISSPVKLKDREKIVGVSSGDNHTIALDMMGNCYAWGQNFDRQLGLYTKSEDDMRQNRSNSMVEEILFQPKFIPFTLRHKVSSVACGSNFSVLVTKDGDIWSVGAGECGQLGTGRCTRKELLTQIPMPCKINQVACGWGHSLALSAEGDVYSWGFNRFGQLGVNDTKSRFYCQSVPNMKLSSIFANGNSSAGITPNGDLYTWGSGSNYRLMHGNENNYLLPTKVEAISKLSDYHCESKDLKPVLISSHEDQGPATDDLRITIDGFAFSPTSSAVIVQSKMLEVILFVSSDFFTYFFILCVQLFPSCGPQKYFQNLKIYGVGFYDSEDILVRFKSVAATSAGGVAVAAPRTSAGKLIAPGVIACRPPRLAVTGEYMVELSLDGTLFLQQGLRLYIYGDYEIMTVSPCITNVNDIETSIPHKSMDIVSQLISQYLYFLTVE
jgi:hypothetical protein